jgi:hypothetical protein
MGRGVGPGISSPNEPLLVRGSSDYGAMEPTRSPSSASLPNELDGEELETEIVRTMYPRQKCQQRGTRASVADSALLMPVVSQSLLEHGRSFAVSKEVRPSQQRPAGPPDGLARQGNTRLFLASGVGRTGSRHAD